MFDEMWTDIAVIGAAGKMGKGIAQLLLQEMAKQELKSTGNVGKNHRALHLIDVDEKSIYAVKSYLRRQLNRYAEKNINELRDLYSRNPKLVSNGEIISDYVEGSIENIYPGTDLKQAQNSKMIFEAVVENIDLKVKILKELKDHSRPDAFFFTNTSSIPISVLESKSKLEQRLIGFHFYNPPAIQKLVELIASKETEQELKSLAADIGKRLGKTLVPSNDIAGFIGNGHFIREAAFACDLAVEKSKEMPLYQAIYEINQVTKEILVRPMGIFQLMDFVGLDVCYKIAETMSHYIPGANLKRDLVQNMILSEHLGGQTMEGSQKDGFFQYRHLDPIGIFDLDSEKYQAFTLPWKSVTDKNLGAIPDPKITWKSLSNDPQKLQKLETYFQQLLHSHTRGVDLARRFFHRSQEIALQLVSDNVALNIKDVNSVLQLGFFHLYGIDQFKM